MGEAADHLCAGNHADCAEERRLPLFECFRDIRDRPMYATQIAMTFVAVVPVDITRRTCRLSSVPAGTASSVTGEASPSSASIIARLPAPPTHIFFVTAARSLRLSGVTAAALRGGKCGWALA